MMDPEKIPPVASEEILARYVVFQSHFRRSNKTVRPEAFVPFPHTEMSVTRHLLAMESELWRIGRDVAEARGRTLYGRADFSAETCRSIRLVVDPAPLDTNPNHANVREWPAEKEQQKMIAIELARVAHFEAVPGSGEASP